MKKAYTDLNLMSILYKHVSPGLKEMITVTFLINRCTKSGLVRFMMLIKFIHVMTCMNSINII